MHIVLEMNCVIVETVTTDKTSQSKLKFRELFSQINTNKL